MAQRKKTKYLVIHVTATKPNQDLSRKDIDAMHKARGWSGIGYNRLIRRDGKVEIGRGDDEVGAHVEGFNSISWGIALVGGVDERGKPANNMTPAQETALVAELKTALKRYPGAVICGHRDLSPDKDGDGVIEPSEHTKACPCFDAIPWAKSKGLPGAPIKGRWADSPAKPGVEPDAKPVGPDTRNIYLQRLLAKAGFAFGAIDGVVGDRTQGALKQLQKSLDYQVTGKFDATTVKYLRNKFETKPVT